MNINPYNLGDYIVPERVRGGVCLEVGANVGNFFSLYKDFFKTIHYYEPVDETYSICVSKSNLMPNVTGHKEVAYSSDGVYLEMVSHQNNESGSCSINDGKQDWTDRVVGSALSVSLETCAERLETDEIDYLKIDCECCEFEFMLDKDLSKIKFIGMELHNQRGEHMWNRLIEHIKKTHSIDGDTTFKHDMNTELFCVRKDLV